MCRVQPLRDAVSLRGQQGVRAGAARQHAPRPPPSRALPSGGLPDARPGDAQLPVRRPCFAIRTAEHAADSPPAHRSLLASESSALTRKLQALGAANGSPKRVAIIGGGLSGAPPLARATWERPADSRPHRLSAPLQACPAPSIWSTPATSRWCWSGRTCSAARSPPGRTRTATGSRRASLLATSAHLQPLFTPLSGSIRFSDRAAHLLWGVPQHDEPVCGARHPGPAAVEGARHDLRHAAGALSARSSLGVLLSPADASMRRARSLPSRRAAARRVHALRLPARRARAVQHAVGHREARGRCQRLRRLRPPRARRSPPSSSFRSSLPPHRSNQKMLSWPEKLQTAPPLVPMLLGGQECVCPCGGPRVAPLGGAPPFEPHPLLFFYLPPSSYSRLCQLHRPAGRAVRVRLDAGQGPAAPHQRRSVHRDGQGAGPSGGGCGGSQAAARPPPRKSRLWLTRCCDRNPAHRRWTSSTLTS